MPDRMTPEIEAFLRREYNNYKNSQLALMLNVRITSVDYWLRRLNLKKTKKEELTPEQMRYVKENYADETVPIMALELDVEEQKILNYINREGIRKPPPSPPKRKQVYRIKPDHQNMNREDYINYWLNTPDPVIKKHDRNQTINR